MNLYWSTTKRVSVWKFRDLDNILSLTYSLYGNSSQQNISFQDTPEHVQLDQEILQVEKLNHKRGVLTLLFNTNFLEVGLRSAEGTRNGMISIITVIRKLRELKTRTLLCFWYVCTLRNRCIIGRSLRGIITISDRKKIFKMHTRSIPLGGNHFWLQNSVYMFCDIARTFWQIICPSEAAKGESLQKKQTNCEDKANYG